MSSENSSCFYPEQDLYLEETLIYLSEIKDGKQAKFYFENDIISRYDLRALYYWGLIDVYGCSCIRKTTLGNKLLYKFFSTWNKGRYSKPLFKEAVYGTLKELFERDSDFKKRLIELLKRRKEQKIKFSSSDNNQTAELPSVSAVSDSPAVPAAPVAGVERPIGRNENYPSTWIYAKGDETVSEFTDNGAAGMVQVGLQSSILTAIQDGFDKVIERQDKAIEIQQQTANNTASIDSKTDGRITRLEDIPPYNPTDKRWVKVAKYSEITDISRENLDTMRSRGDNKAPDNNSGIHGEHCWRRVNGNILYYVYQPKYLDLL